MALGLHEKTVIGLTAEIAKVQRQIALLDSLPTRDQLTDSLAQLKWLRGDSDV